MKKSNSQTQKMISEVVRERIAILDAAKDVAKAPKDSTMRLKQNEYTSLCFKLKQIQENVENIDAIREELTLLQEECLKQLDDVSTQLDNLIRQLHITKEDLVDGDASTLNLSYSVRSKLLILNDRLDSISEVSAAIDEYLINNENEEES